MTEQRSKFEAAFGGDESPPMLYTTVDGMVRKSWVNSPAALDSRYPDSIYYLPFVPELDVKARTEAMKFAPPHMVPELLIASRVFDTGGPLLEGSSERLPHELWQVPVLPGSGDNTCERAVKPGKYNWDEDRNRPKRQSKYFVLMYRSDGDAPPEPTVMTLGPKQMSELCMQLQTHKKYVKDLVGAPMKILKNDDHTVFVDIEPDEPKLDPSAMPVRDESGRSILYAHLDAVRSEFEKWLLEHGWECTTESDGTFTDFRRSQEGRPPWEPDPEPRAAANKVPTRAALIDLLEDSGVEFDQHATKLDLVAVAKQHSLL